MGNPSRRYRGIVGRQKRQFYRWRNHHGGLNESELKPIFQSH